MLVFSAIVPHSPLLIPDIGKEHLKKLKKTAGAFDILEEDLNAARPDTIVIISPHGDINPGAFKINTSASYRAHFQNFGDFATNLEFKSDLQLVNEIKSRHEIKIPVQLTGEENLDHGCSVPLYYLTRKNKNVRVVPITYSHLNYRSHLEFGAAMKDAIFGLDKRVAVIASGDLSHRLSLNAPAGFLPIAKEFDKRLIQLLKKQNLDAILNLDETLINDAAECGLRSFLILLGAIKNMKYDFQVLSYESPFGVGYLVGEFKLL